MRERQRGKGAVAAVLGLLALGVAPAGLEAQAGDTHRVGGREVAVYNLAGDVEVVQGSGPEVVVEVMRGGADADQLRVETGEIRGRQTLRVVYPSDDVVVERSGWRGNTELTVRPDGTFSDEGRGGDRVRISSSGRGLEAWADLRVQVPSGTDFALYLAVGETTVDGVTGDLMIDTHSGAVQTRGTRGNLSVDTGSGSVSVEDAEGGEISVDTGSGSVDVFGVRGDVVDVDTGSGSVEGRDLSASSLRVDTGSGGIELADVTSSDVYLDTGSGSVTVDLTGDVESLEVDTGSGSVTVRLPEGVGASVELDTGSGGIDVDLPVRVRSVERTHLTGEIGDGRGRITIDTGSGGIRLLRR